MLLIILALSTLVAEKVDQYVLLISFDGFRADYLDWYNTPNFDMMTNGGFKTKGLKPVFVSKTFPNHYSIATGMYPENHGIISNKFYDKELKETYCLCDPAAVQDFKWYSGEPIWVTAEKQGIKTASFYWVGSVAPVDGVLPGITKKYDESVSFQTRIDSVAKWFSLPEKERPQLILLYFHEPDATGHNFGPRSEETEQKIEEMDRVLGQIVEKMGETPVASQLNYIVVSDHGMVDIDSTRIIDLSEIPELDSLTQEGTGPYAFFYGSASENYENIKNKIEPFPNFDTYLKDEILDRWHFKNNVRIKDMLLVADEGWSILNVKNPRPDWIGLGTHGYDNQLWSMHGILLGSGPAFKRGYTRSTIENIHIYPLIAEILGLRPFREIDGRLDLIEDLLKERKK